MTAVQSSAFLPETDGWTAVDAGDGDRYAHAQGNYFPLPVWDEQGAARYKVCSAAQAEEERAQVVTVFRQGDELLCVAVRPQEERNADYSTAEHVLSDAQRIAALEDELAAARILLGLEPRDGAAAD